MDEKWINKLVEDIKEKLELFGLENLVKDYNEETIVTITSNDGAIKVFNGEIDYNDNEVVSISAYDLVKGVFVNGKRESFKVNRQAVYDFVKYA